MRHCLPGIWSANMSQFTLGVKLLSHISHCKSDSWNLRAEECSFYTSILSHICKYHLGYVKVWLDNAGSHLSGMTECVLRLSILPASNHPGGVLGALHGQRQQSFIVALVWCGIPSQISRVLAWTVLFPLLPQIWPRSSAVGKLYSQEPTLASLEQLAEEEI